MCLIVVLIAVSCASQKSHRDPASVKQEQETSHEKFQGVFDKQY
jgi:hypothetical protein